MNCGPGPVGRRRFGTTQADRRSRVVANRRGRDGAVLMASRRDGGMRVPAGPGRRLRVHCPATASPSPRAYPWSGCRALVSRSPRSQWSRGTRNRTESADPLARRMGCAPHCDPESAKPTNVNLTECGREAHAGSGLDAAFPATRGRRLIGALARAAWSLQPGMGECISDSAPSPHPARCAASATPAPAAYSGCSRRPGCRDASWLEPGNGTCATTGARGDHGTPVAFCSVE